MKANAPRRRIFNDAIDVLTGPEAGEGGGISIQEIPIGSIDYFSDHPFRLYDGERLEDMVDSVRTHGILTPVIVRRIGSRYEMLAGHNRMNAAKLAGLDTIPAIVKDDVSDEDAYVYVIETNLMQRSFSDFLPSEKAAILKTRYETIKSQGKRNDIIREIAELEGVGVEDVSWGLIDQKASKGASGLIDQKISKGTSGLIDQKASKGTSGLIDQKTNKETSGLIDQKLDGRTATGMEYGLSSKSVARLLRVNYLIAEFKDKLDRNELPLYAAVELSFLPEQAQEWIYKASEEYGFKINMKTAKLFREEGEDLTEERVRKMAEELTKKKEIPTTYQKVMIPKIVYKKYFKGMPDYKVQAIIQVAIDRYFAENK